MKVWERVIEHRFRRKTSLLEKQFGFMADKTYEGVPKDIIWWVLKRK